MDETIYTAGEVRKGEELLTLEQARSLRPLYYNGRPRSKISIWKLAAKGIQGDDGRTVRLATIRVGGRLYTSAAAAERWRDAVCGFDRRRQPSRLDRQTEDRLGRLGVAVGPSD